MTEEQIKQKAEAEADKVVIGSGMDRASVIHLRHLLVTMYMQGATEATKKLEEKLEQTEKDLADYQFNYPTIKELQKENAELKHQLNKNPCVCNTEWHCNDCLEQLTNAKEIIKQLMKAIPYGSGKLATEAYDKAEQFLKEE